MSVVSFTRKESELTQPSADVELPYPIDLATIKYTSGTVVQRTDTMARWVIHLPSSQGVFSYPCVCVRGCLVGVDRGSNVFVLCLVSCGNHVPPLSVS